METGESVMHNYYMMLFNCGIMIIGFVSLILLTLVILLACDFWWSDRIVDAIIGNILDISELIKIQSRLLWRKYIPCKWVDANKNSLSLSDIVQIRDNSYHRGYPAKIIELKISEKGIPLVKVESYSFDPLFRPLTFICFPNECEKLSDAQAMLIKLELK